MVASVKTVSEMLVIMMKYVPREKIPAMLADLSKVQGNASFVATIKRLQEEFKKDS